LDQCEARYLDRSRTEFDPAVTVLRHENGRVRGSAGLTGDTFLNLWPEAIKEAQKRFSGVDVIAGINSFDGRTKNQLHIHLTAFFNPARQMLDKLTNITSKPDEWNSSIYVLEGSSNPPAALTSPSPTGSFT